MTTLALTFEDYLKHNTWVDDAACAGEDPALFFPAVGQHGAAISEAKAICARCPVKADCLDYALRHREEHGIWGGTTDWERRRMRSSRRRAL